MAKRDPAKQKSNSNSELGLRQFLDSLREQKELAVIEKLVDLKFELAAVTAKFDGKQALLFRNVRGSKISVASNIVGTPKRFLLAAGGMLEGKTSLRQAVHSRMTEALATSSAPGESESKPPFSENTSRSLHVLPIVTHFEKDAGPFVTSSVVFARDQERGNQNSSTHRLLPISDTRMAIRMVEGRHLHKCFSYAKEHGEDLRVAIAIGVHPAVGIAAAYQAAYGTDEMNIANSLLNGNLPLAKLSRSGLSVPATSEIILEGKILADVTHEEWMVEMLRTYDFKRKQPVFELDSIQFRDGAIFHDILPGYAEHRLLMGLPVEAKIFDQVKSVVPTTMSVHLTNGGCNWLAAVIQIRKRLEGEPKNAILAAFAAHPSLKMATVVDSDIDPSNASEVEYALATRLQANTGMLVIPNVKGSSLDPSSDQVNLLTTKLGIDATASLLKPSERFEIARIPREKDISIEDYLQ